MKVIKPWDADIVVEIDPELSSTDGIAHFGFDESTVVGARCYLRINSRHLICLAKGDYDMDEVWLLGNDWFVALVGGRAYYVSIESSLRCEIIREFPIIDCATVPEARILIMNTFTDVVFIGSEGSLDVLHHVVDDDLEIECEYPLLKLKGSVSGHAAARSYDMVGKQYF